MTSEQTTKCDLYIPNKDINGDPRIRENFNAIERWAGFFRKNCLPSSGGGAATAPKAWCGSDGLTLDTSAGGTTTPIDVSDHIGDRLFVTVTLGISTSTPPATMGFFGYFVLDGITLNLHPSIRENGVTMPVAPAGGSDTTRAASCIIKSGNNVAYNIQNQYDPMAYGVHLDIIDVTGTSFCCDQQHE